MAVFNLVDDMLKLAGKIGGKAPGRYPTRNTAQTNAARGRLSRPTNYSSGQPIYVDPSGAPGTVGFQRPVGAADMPYAGDSLGGRVRSAAGRVSGASGRGAQATGWSRPFPNLGMPSVSRAGTSAAGRRVVGGGARSFLGPGGLIISGLAQGGLDAYGDEQGALSKLGSGARGFVGGTDLTSLVPNQIMGHSTGRWGKGYSQFLPESGYEKTQRSNELDQSIASNQAKVADLQAAAQQKDTASLRDYDLEAGMGQRGFFKDQNSRTGWSYTNGKGIVARGVDGPQNKWNKVFTGNGERHSAGLLPGAYAYEEKNFAPQQKPSVSQLPPPMIDPYNYPLGLY